MTRSGISGWAKNPVPVRRRELGVRTLEVFDYRNAIQKRDSAHGLRVIEGESKRDVAAPIVPCERESLVSECEHDLEHVCSDGAFAVRGVVRARRGTA